MGNKILKYCRICYSKKLVRYLDLGKHPFSNSFLRYKDIKKEKNVIINETDTNININNEEIKSIFETFYRMGREIKK